MTAEQKYELTDQTKEIEVDGHAHTLRRIRLLRPIHYYRAGALGGWIESEANLSQVGNCLVLREAMVFGEAKVSDNAFVAGRAMIYGGSHVGGSARFGDDARCFACASVIGHTCVRGDAQILGTAHLSGSANIKSGGYIQDERDVLVIEPIGSEDGTLTIYRTRDGMRVTRGCFEGTPEQFCRAVLNNHGDNIFAQEYLKVLELAEIRFGRAVAVNTIVAEEQAAADETFALKP